MRVSSSNTTDGEFKTLDGGHTLHVPVKHSDLSPLNQPVFLAIRPEHVQLRPNGERPQIPCAETFARSFSPARLRLFASMRRDCCWKRSCCSQRIQWTRNAPSSSRRTGSPYCKTNADEEELAVPFAITAVVLIYGVIYPNLFVAMTSLQRDGAWTLANYYEVLSQSIVIEAILNSIGLSVFTVLLCAIVGAHWRFCLNVSTFPADASSLRSLRCHSSCRHSSEQLLSFFYTASRAYWPTVFKTSSHSKRRRGVCKVGRRCCFFTRTRCIRFSTC